MRKLPTKFQFKSIHQTKPALHWGSSFFPLKIIFMDIDSSRKWIVLTVFNFNFSHEITNDANTHRSVIDNFIIKNLHIARSQYQHASASWNLRNNISLWSKIGKIILNNFIVEYTRKSTFFYNQVRQIKYQNTSSIPKCGIVEYIRIE